MKEILQELEEVTDWYYLGLCLGVEEPRLKAIRKDNKGNENRKRAMLFAWSKLQVPTWRKVVRALLEMGERVLAEKIAKKYGKFIMVFILHQSIKGSKGDLDRFYILISQVYLSQSSRSVPDLRKKTKKRKRRNLR